MEEAKPKKLRDSKEEDRISKFPEELLHRILCFLDQQTAIRTCVLSKAWRYLGCTRPKIDFSLIGWRVALESALDPILQACHDRNLRLDEFAVRFSSRALLLQKWIPTIIQNMCVKSFRLINVRTNKNGRAQYFRLPSLIIESHHIQNLSLHGCKFQSSSSTTITHEVRVYLQCLQTLWLDNVRIPEDILNNILSNCPFLEDVYLEDCKGLKRIKLFMNHNNKPTKLSRFYLKGNGTRPEVSIEIGDDDLQTLTSVELESCLLSVSHNKPLEIRDDGLETLEGMNLLSDLFPCNFTTLSLCDVDIPEEILDIILSDCPFIETVSLFECRGFKRIKMSSNKPTNLAHFCFHGGNHLHDRDVSIEIGDHIQTLRSIEIRRCLFYVSHDKPLEFARLTRLILDCHVQLMSPESSFSCNLHSLEELELDGCYGIKEFKLSSRSMKRLSISNRFQTLFKANINAPSIVSFKYEGILPKSISFAGPKTSNSEDLWESNINLESSPYDDHEPSHCFNELYSLLDALHQSEISLELEQIEIFRLWGQLPIGDSPLEGIKNDYIVGVTERKQLPVVVEHLKIMWPEENMHPSAAPFLNMLFQMFRPSFIYIGTYMLINPRSQHREIAELLFKLREMAQSYFWQRVLEGVGLQVKYHWKQCEWQPAEYTSLIEVCKKGAELRIQLKWRE